MPLFLNDIVVGLSAICGSVSPPTSVTVTCTVTVCGELGALPLTVIVPVWVPAARLAAFTDTCAVELEPPVAEPLPGPTLSQLRSSPTLQFSVPPPEF